MDMMMKEQEMQYMVDAIRKHCGGAVKTFTDVMIFIYGYCPECTVAEAVHIAGDLKKDGLIC